MASFDSMVGPPRERGSARCERSAPSRRLCLDLAGVRGCSSPLAVRIAAPRPRTSRRCSLPLRGSRVVAELHDGQVLAALDVFAHQFETSSRSSWQALRAAPRERIHHEPLALIEAA